MILFCICVRFLEGAVVALAIFLGADMISRHLMESPLSVYTLKVLAPALFIVAVLGVMRGYFQGMGTMVPTAISQVLEQIINAHLKIRKAFLGWCIAIFVETSLDTAIGRLKEDSISAIA